MVLSLKTHKNPVQSMTSNCNTPNCHTFCLFCFIIVQNSIFLVNVPKLSHFFAVFLGKKCDNLRSWTVYETVSFKLQRRREKTLQLCLGLLNAMSSVIDGKIMVTLIFRSKVEIWEYDQLGARKELVWSIEQNCITGSLRGASSVIYESQNATNWVARLTPEAKLERLVNNGELTVASEFARRYNLDRRRFFRSDQTSIQNLSP